MNEYYLFLDNLSLLLRNGYSIKESLEICYKIKPLDVIVDIEELLLDGDNIESILLKVKLPSLFKEYYNFFENKNSLSDAIGASLKVCRMQDSYIKKIKKDFTYPLILIVFLLFFSIFVVFVLMPKVNGLYDSFGLNVDFIFELMMYIFYCLPIFVIVAVVVFMFLLINLLLNLKSKNISVIEKYFRIPFFKMYLKKYFSLKFAFFYSELLKEQIDSSSIISKLNIQLNNSDIKIVLFEIEKRMKQGELIEDILNVLEYFDNLLCVFFRMLFQYHNNNALNDYINVSINGLEISVKKYVKLITCFVYCFVASFVIMVYLSIIIPMMNVISNI